MEKVYEVSDLLWGASFQKEVNIVKYSNELSKFLLVEEKILGEVKQKRCWGYLYPLLLGRPHVPKSVW